MKHRVDVYEDLQRELKEFPGVIPTLSKRVIMLQEQGKGLSYPYTKRLDVSRGAQPLMNLRFHAANGVWRVPYCLVQSGVDEYFLLLAIGNKQGIDPGGNASRRFYEGLVDESQKRLEASSATAVWP